MQKFFRKIGRWNKLLLVLATLAAMLVAYRLLMRERLVIPVNTETVETWCLAHNTKCMQKHAIDRNVYVLKGGLFRNGGSEIMAPDETLLSDLSRAGSRAALSNEILKRNPHNRLARQSRRSQSKHERVLVIGSLGSSNYFHWMTQIVPRFFLARSAGFDSDTIACSLENLSFQTETLDVLKIDRRRILPTSDNWQEANELIVPEIPFVTSEKWETFPGWIQEQWLSTLGMESRKHLGTKRLLVLRGKEQSRSFVNEKELVSSLSRLGFVSVRLEKMSIMQQAELFQSAEVVVAAHGAALTNLIFATRGATIIELQDADQTNPVYKNISKSLGLTYLSLRTDPKILSQGEREKFSVHVPAADVMKVLAGILAMPRAPTSALYST